MSERRSDRGVLYIVCCGSPRGRKVAELVTRAQARGWDTCVVATPMGLRFLDVPAVEKLTGRPVSSEYRNPQEKAPLPPADAIVVCPATFNTINSWAAGLANTFALGLLTEAVGWGIPLVAAPALNSAQAAHPGFGRSLDALRAMGVRVIYGPGEYEPAPPRSGGRPYPWDLPLDALEELLSAR